MASINEILTYVNFHKEFTRRDLIVSLKSNVGTSSSGTLSEQLNRLIKSGHIHRIKRGLYKISDYSKNVFSVICSEDLKFLDQQLKKQFPYVEYCLWSVSNLKSYMLHIPNLNFLFIDVKREATESVFDFLNTNSNKRVFPLPSITNFERYIGLNDAIIIRPLVSESPLQLVEGINTPTIEKVLVDMVGDVEFSFLKDSEIIYVYTTVFEKHNVNKKNSYATHPVVDERKKLSNSLSPIVFEPKTFKRPKKSNHHKKPS